MNRRRFLAAAAVSAARLNADNPKGKLLLPSDEADELGFRLMWYNPVQAIDPATYQLKIHGLVEKPHSLSIGDLRRLPQEVQNTRMKCVQCWSSRTDLGRLPLRPSPRSGQAPADRQSRAIRLRRQVVRVLVHRRRCSSRASCWCSTWPETAGRPSWRTAAPDRPRPLRLQIGQAHHLRSSSSRKARAAWLATLDPITLPREKSNPGYDHPLDLGAEVAPENLRR